MGRFFLIVLRIEIVTGFRGELLNKLSPESLNHPWLCESAARGVMIPEKNAAIVKPREVKQMNEAEMLVVAERLFMSVLVAWVGKVLFFNNWKDDGKQK